MLAVTAVQASSLTLKRKTMGIIIGNQTVETTKVVQPTDEKNVTEALQEAEKEAVSAEQEPVEVDAPTEDLALKQEVVKPVKRGRKRK